MRTITMVLALIGAILIPMTAVQAQVPQAVPTLSDPALEKERQKLILERMHLENDKARLELEKAKAQATAPIPVTMIQEKEEGNQEKVKAFQAGISSKAEALGSTGKDQDDLVVFDLVNSEIWHHGVRYSLHSLESLAKDMGWPNKRKLVGRLPNGYPRTLFLVRNLSLLRYQGNERGIVEWVLPKSAGDFGFQTPEGISQLSTIGDVRNAYQSLYFSFEWQQEKGKDTILRYKHSRGLNFDDKLEFVFDKEGKIIKVRYGVLDEH